MKLEPTRVDGAYIVVRSRHWTARLLSARVFSAPAFEQAGLVATVAESSISTNRARHTLRGLHYQDPPHAEAKLVRCTRGAVFDVVVDLRPSSTTYLAWDAVELREDNLLALYVPPGAAHGFLTLEDDATSALSDLPSAHSRCDAGRALERSGIRDRLACGAASDTRARRDLSRLRASSRRL